MRIQTNVPNGASYPRPVEHPPKPENRDTDDWGQAAISKIAICVNLVRSALLVVQQAVSRTIGVEPNMQHMLCSEVWESTLPKYEDGTL